MALHEALKKPLYLSLNICSSVLIVLVNRFVMSSFKFVSLLSGLHLLVSGVFVRVFQGHKGSSDTKLDVGTILLIVWTVSSLESLNASLMLNTVSFYQATKLLIIPCSAIIEYCSGGKRLSRWQLLFLIQTLVGVALVTINDLTFDIHTSGMIIAMMAVLTSSLQQTSVRKLQSVKKKGALDLVASVGPGSGIILILCSPIMDYKVANQWITEYYWSSTTIWALVLSTSLAILVNISQYLCLGKFSAVEFQMMGHVKTVAIFAISWIVLQENFSGVKWLGCCLTISGLYLFNKQPKHLILQQAAKLDNLVSEEIKTTMMK